MAKILITGSNRGLGAALMARARAEGHDPIGTTRDGRDGTVALTLDDPATVAAQLQDIGPLDILINNAGIIGPDRQSPLDMDFAGFAETLAVNTMAPLAVAQAVLPNLRESPAPRILTVSSQMAWMGYRKADGIPVALVDPGWVSTDMGGAEADESPVEVAAGILAIAARLTMKDTGKFFRFTGEEREF